MAFGMATVQGLAACHPNMASTLVWLGEAELGRAGQGRDKASTAARHGMEWQGKAPRGSAGARQVPRHLPGLVWRGWRCDAMPGAARHGRDKASTVAGIGSAGLGWAWPGSARQGKTGNQQGD